MTRGFVTIATGKEKFYMLAANLLASYRCFTDNPMPFAIMCDQKNKYTEAFSDVVILPDPCFSYNDKLSLPDLAPYDETIFIDADSLAYRDLNDFWKYFPREADFSACGRDYPADYPYAWFLRENVGEYASLVNYIPEFVGGVYFIRKGEKLKEFSELSRKIRDNYHQYTFRIFTDPCDEPVFALAMSVMNFRMVDETLVPSCFYRNARNFTCNMTKGFVRWINIYDQENRVRSGAYLIHWGNDATNKPVYWKEIVRLIRMARRKGVKSVISQAYAYKRVIGYWYYHVIRGLKKKLRGS